MYYAHQYIDVDKYQIVKYFDDGSSQNISKVDAGYIQWIEQNTPEIELKNPLLMAADGVVIINDAKKSEYEKINFNNQIYARLNEIDLKSIRAIRDGDAEWIEKYKTDAAAERLRLIK